MQKNKLFCLIIGAWLLIANVKADSPIPLSINHLDGLFGNMGVAQYNQSTVQTSPNLLLSAVLPDNRNIILMNFETTPNGLDSPSVLVAVNSDGTLDKNFGTQAYVSLVFKVRPLWRSERSTQNTVGSISLLVNDQRIYVINSVQQTLTIQSFTLTGLPDTTFMPLGHLILPNDSYRLLDAQLQSDCKIVLAYSRSHSQTLEGVVLRITQDGQIDPTFANHQPLNFTSSFWDFTKLVLNRQKIGFVIRDGIIWLSANGRQTGQFELKPYANLLCSNSSSMAMKEIGPDGSFVATVSCEQDRKFLLRFNANQQPDTKFGSQGIIELSRDQYPLDIFLLPSGQILLSTFSNLRLAFFKFQPNGQPDTNYPTNIIAASNYYFYPNFPIGYYTVRPNSEIRGLLYQSFAPSVSIGNPPDSAYAYFHITPEGLLNQKAIDLQFNRNTFEAASTFSHVNTDGSSTILFGLNQLAFTDESDSKSLGAFFLTENGTINPMVRQHETTIFPQGNYIRNNSLIVLPNGQWLLKNEVGIWRFNADLSIDNSFPPLPISFGSQMRDEKIATIAALPNNDYVLLTAQCVETSSGRGGEYCTKSAMRLYKLDQHNMLLAGQNREILAYGQDYGNNITVTPNGSFIILSYYPTNINIRRYHSDLTADPTFGINGILVGPSGNQFTDLLVSEDESIYIISSPYPQCICQPPDLRIAKYQPNGLSDLAYGKQGVVIVKGVSLTGKSDIKPDGNVIIPVQTQYGDSSINPSDLYQDISILHLLPNGVPDPAWGNRGVYTLQGYRGKVASAHWLKNENKQILLIATILTGVANDTTDIGVFKLVDTPTSKFKYQNWLPLVGKMR